MPYLAGLKNVACAPIRKSTASCSVEAAGRERRDRERHRDDLEDLHRDEHAPLAEAIGEVAGVAGEEQERQR